MTAALQFRDLTLGYDQHPAVHHLDGAIETGALVAVVGPNGAGKSTLFKGIVGLIKPLAGRIERGDVPAQNIAYLPQAAEIDRTFPINVYDMAYSMCLPVFGSSLPRNCSPKFEYQASPFTMITSCGSMVGRGRSYSVMMTLVPRPLTRGRVLSSNSCFMEQ